MTNTDTSQQFISKTDKRLFLLFVSQFMSPFPYNHVRSFVQYFEQNSIFPLIEYNPNLYTASESLTSDYRPIVYHWRLPDDSIEQITITITPQADSNYLLIWDLGGSKVAEYLIGSKATPLAIKKLKKLVWAGLNMSGSYIAGLTYESSPNQDVQMSIADTIYLSLSKLPIILSAKLGLSPYLTCIGHEHPTLFFNNYLGSDNLVFIPEPLPLELSKPEPNFSIWVDENSQMYYKVYDSLVLPVGEESFRNCLSSKIKYLNTEKLAPYAITSEVAGNYLEVELEQSFNSAIGVVNDWISEQVNPANIEQTIKFDQIFSKTNWTSIVCEFFEVTELQLSRNPKLLETRLLELLIQFQSLIKDDKSVSDEAKNSAQKTLIKLQNILAAHNINIGNSIEQLIISIQQLRSIDHKSINKSEDRIQLRKIIDFFALVNLTDTDLENLITEIVNKYQKTGNQNLDPDAGDRKSKSAGLDRNIIKEVTDEYPLPLFSFDDLLSENG